VWPAEIGSETMAITLPSHCWKASTSLSFVHLLDSLRSQSTDDGKAVGCLGGLACFASYPSFCRVPSRSVAGFMGGQLYQISTHLPPGTKVWRLSDTCVYSLRHAIQLCRTGPLRNYIEAMQGGLRPKSDERKDVFRRMADATEVVS
jgi:hypothetical protein